MKSNDRLLIVAAGAIGIAIAFSIGNRSPAPSIPTTSSPIPAPVKKIELLFFTMPGCVPCSKLKEAMKDPSVKQYLDEHFTLKMVDSSDPLAEKNSVRVVPTLVAIQASGIVKRHVGSMSSSEVLKWLKSIP